MTPEDVSEKLNELCGYMGSFSTACMQTVQEQSTVSISYYAVLINCLCLI